MYIDKGSWRWVYQNQPFCHKVELSIHHHHHHHHLISLRCRLHKYSEEDIKNVLWFIVDNIYVVFLDQVFIEFPMYTNCATVLTELHVFLFSLDGDINKILKSFFINNTYRFINQQTQFSPLSPFDTSRLTPNKGHNTIWHTCICFTFVHFIQWFYYVMSDWRILCNTFWRPSQAILTSTNKWKI
jgi:hypothetical protein